MNRDLYRWLHRTLERSPRLELTLRWIIWLILIGGAVQITRAVLAR